MSDLGGWVTDPVTLIFFGLVLALLFSVIEVLLRSLAELGNVRFQGIIEDHPKLFPLPAGADLHLSRLQDVLRWLQIASLGLLWLDLLELLAERDWQVFGIVLAGLVLPFVLVLVSRLAARGVGEPGVARLLWMVRILIRPLLRLTGRGTAYQVEPEDEEEEASEREIKAFLDVGQAAGIFESDEGQIVQSLLVDFFDTTVREVMTPRTDMVAVADTAATEELMEAFATTHRSRIPVYQGTVDHVVGLVHVKAMVEHLIGGRRPAVSELVRDCLVVPEGKELGDLLRDFQQQKQQMAIVVDEYGGTSGLVTLEDILEEIVGEILDEHDSEQPPDSKELGPDKYRLQGRAQLELLQDLFGVVIDEDDLDTVGGLVFARHGTVPAPGTEVVDEALGLVFIVEEMQERRIVSVTVERAPGHQDPDHE